MTKQERIFDAIGGVDVMLLARSERTVRRHTRRWVIWGAAMAACLALALLLWDMPPKSPAVEPDDSVIDADAWGDGQRVHLLSFQVPQVEQSNPQFYLYIDEESYYTCWQDGVYVIQPQNSPENLPECVMQVSYMEAAPEQAAETVRADLQSRYASVTEIGEVTDDISRKLPDNTLCYFVASDGMAWDDAQRETFLVSGGQDGVFVVSYSYFTEAAEGHGTRFAGMAATFQVVPADDVPAWLAELNDTVERLMRGVFSGRMEDAADLLLPTAEVEKYDVGMADDVVIHSVDKVVNNEIDPTAAIVKIPYSLSPEEPGGTLVMELAYAKDNNRWLAWRIGLEQ